jgi:hypothetical protein
MTRFAPGIWRRAWIVALATAGAALAAHIAVADHPRVHEAKAVLLVGPAQGRDRHRCARRARSPRPMPSSPGVARCSPRRIAGYTSAARE